MAPFLDRKPCDVFEEHHVHWQSAGSMALPFVSIAWPHHEEHFGPGMHCNKRLADYPLLDEDDYSSRVFEATLAISTMRHGG